MLFGAFVHFTVFILCRSISRYLISQSVFIFFSFFPNACTAYLSWLGLRGTAIMTNSGMNIHELLSIHWDFSKHTGNSPMTKAAHAWFHSKSASIRRTAVLLSYLVGYSNMELTTYCTFSICVGQLRTTASYSMLSSVWVFYFPYVLYFVHFIADTQLKALWLYSRLWMALHLPTSVFRSGK